MDIDGIPGQVITADHFDYDTARAVWNGTVDRCPRLIAISLAVSGRLLISWMSSSVRQGPKE